MTEQDLRALAFLELHQPGTPLLMPNPWDAGTTKLLASLGFRALATTSAGYAGTLGRGDYGLSREEALAHASIIVTATDLPVNADLENGFSDSPAGVAESVRLAAQTGLAGCSIEDFSGRADDPIYERGLAIERIAAGAEAARQADRRIILTARTENHLHGRNSVDDTVARLRAFAEAGADVVYAPGLTKHADIARVVGECGAPVNVLTLPSGPDVAELASLGVSRISVGSGFYLAAFQATAECGRELLERGSLDFWKQAVKGGKARESAF